MDKKGDNSFDIRIKGKLLGGILVWLLLSFSLYSFLYCFREMFRLMAFHLSREFLELTEHEHNFYNLFFSSIACINSLGFLTSLYLRRGSIRFGRNHLHKTLIINEQNSLNWYFLFWLTKLGGFYGLMILGTPLFYFIDFYNDFKFIFIATPLVLFLYQWSTLRLALAGKWGLKAMVMVGLIVFSVSYLFSRIDTINFEAINSSIKKHIVSYNYKIDLPFASEAKPISRRFTAGQLNYGLPLDTMQGKSITIVIENEGLKIIPINQVDDYVNEVCEMLDEYDNDAFIVLRIDSNVSLRDYKSLTRELGQNKKCQLHFYLETMTMEKGVHYGLPWNYFSACNDPKVLEYIRKNGVFPKESSCLILKTFVDELPVQRMKISLSVNQIFVNGAEATREELFVSVYKYIVALGQKGIVELYLDDNSDYGHYIELNNILRKVYNTRRNQLAHELFQTEFSEIDSQLDSASLSMTYKIRTICPVNIVEWTDMEKEIIELLK